MSSTDHDIYDAYSYWKGIPTLLGCELKEDFSEMDIALAGLPWTHNTIERTQYLAPRAVRHRSRAYHRVHREFKINPFELARIYDIGDVPFKTYNPDIAVDEIQHFYDNLDAKSIRPFTIGGDHAVTLPILRAIAGPKSRINGPIGMIHFDAHTDTYETVPGGVVHEAGSGFRIGAEEGLIDPSRCIQIGMKGPKFSHDMDKFSESVGYRLISYNEIEEIGVDAVISEVRNIIGDGPVYISVDLDVLTLADAPAVADPEAGGLTINQLFKMLLGFRGFNVVGGDIVCFVPHLDPSMVTAIHSNAIMHHIVTIMAEAVAREKQQI